MTTGWFWIQGQGHSQGRAQKMQLSSVHAFVVSLAWAWPFVDSWGHGNWADVVTAPGNLTVYWCRQVSKGIITVLVDKLIWTRSTLSWDRILSCNSLSVIFFFIKFPETYENERLKQVWPDTVKLSGILCPQLPAPPTCPQSGEILTLLPWEKNSTGPVNLTPPGWKLYPLELEFPQAAETLTPGSYWIILFSVNCPLYIHCLAELHLGQSPRAGWQIWERSLVPNLGSKLWVWLSLWLTMWAWV